MISMVSMSFWVISPLNITKVTWIASQDDKSQLTAAGPDLNAIFNRLKIVRAIFIEPHRHSFPLMSFVEYLFRDGMFQGRGEDAELEIELSAEGVLKLRSLKASDALDDYLEFHFLQEKERNYPG